MGDIIFIDVLRDEGRVNVVTVTVAVTVVVFVGILGGGSRYIGWPGRHISFGLGFINIFDNFIFIFHGFGHIKIFRQFILELISDIQYTMHDIVFIINIGYGHNHSFERYILMFLKG